MAPNHAQYDLSTILLIFHGVAVHFMPQFSRVEQIVVGTVSQKYFNVAIKHWHCSPKRVTRGPGEGLAKCHVMEWGC
jgi:hypothetical protein